MLPATDIGLLQLSIALAGMSVLPLDPGLRICADHDPLDQCPLCKKFHPATDGWVAPFDSAALAADFQATHTEEIASCPNDCGSQFFDDMQVDFEANPTPCADSRTADRVARDCTDRSAPGPHSNADYLGGASDQCPTEYRS